jgi:hypothetical protein
MQGCNGGEAKPNPRFTLSAKTLKFRSQAIALIEGFECFYEKVIKVKADVAALLNLFSDV